MVILVPRQYICDRVVTARDITIDTGNVFRQSGVGYYGAAATVCDLITRLAVLTAAGVPTPIIYTSHPGQSQEG